MPGFTSPSSRLTVKPAVTHIVYASSSSCPLHLGTPPPSRSPPPSPALLPSPPPPPPPLRPRRWSWGGWSSGPRPAGWPSWLGGARSPSHSSGDICWSPGSSPSTSVVLAVRRFFSENSGTLRSWWTPWEAPVVWIVFVSRPVSYRQPGKDLCRISRAPQFLSSLPFSGETCQ